MMNTLLMLILVFFLQGCSSSGDSGVLVDETGSALTENGSYLDRATGGGVLASDGQYTAYLKLNTLNGGVSASVYNEFTDPFLSQGMALVDEQVGIDDEEEVWRRFP